MQRVANPGAHRSKQTQEWQKACIVMKMHKHAHARTPTSDATSLTGRVVHHSELN